MNYIVYKIIYNIYYTINKIFIFKI